MLWNLYGVRWFYCSSENRSNKELLAEPAWRSYWLCKKRVSLSNEKNCCFCFEMDQFPRLLSSFRWICSFQTMMPGGARAADKLASKLCFELESLTVKRLTSKLVVDSLGRYQILVCLAAMKTVANLAWRLWRRYKIHPAYLPEFPGVMALRMPCQWGCELIHCGLALTQVRLSSKCVPRCWRYAGKFWKRIHTRWVSVSRSQVLRKFRWEIRSNQVLIVQYC